MADAVSRYPSLAGKVAVVTGGSGAIGGATCRALARQGVAIAVSGRKQEQLDDVNGGFAML
jgi:3-oxoacyl-[acyl-carrier protein] reductase